MSRPSGLIFETAMLQVEYGITLFTRSVVTGWGVDKTTAPCTGNFRVVVKLADLSVRHILQCIERLIMGWDLDSAAPASCSIEVAGSRIRY